MATSPSRCVAVGLLAWVLASGGCVPDADFDSPCDRASPRWDPCSCRADEVPDHATCASEADGGITVTCPHEAGWCVEQDVCCATGQRCDRKRDPAECYAPACDGKACGDDGRGGSCGVCASGTSCVKGMCEPAAP